jgi:hypothetical protein
MSGSTGQKPSCRMSEIDFRLFARLRRPNITIESRFDPK